MEAQLGPGHETTSLADETVFAGSLWTRNLMYQAAGATLTEASVAESVGGSSARSHVFSSQVASHLRLEYRASQRRR